MWKSRETVLASIVFNIYSLIIDQFGIQLYRCICSTRKICPQEEASIVILDRCSKPVWRLWLKNPKVDLPYLHAAGIYKIPRVCEFCHIGQTCRPVSIRLKKKKNTAQMLNINELVSQRWCKYWIWCKII